MKNIIVRLANGIGNQLFTYAAAFNYSKKINANLLIDDISGFHKRHKYELNNFNLSAKIANNNYKFVGHIGRLKRKIYKKFNFINRNITFIEEKKDQNKLTEYDKDIFTENVNKNIYFEGYFQTEKYFKEVKNDILKEFSFKDKIINEKNKFKDLILNTNSISIHIRNNKFLKSENHKNIDKLNEENFKLNIDITKKGIDFFERRFDDPKFFIWSNDFSGLKENFPSDKYVFVNNKTHIDDVYDLYLMTLCKNFIISPSTFSYWGAFLSNNKNKICLGPPNIKNKSGYYGFSNNKDIKPDWWF